MLVDDEQKIIELAQIYIEQAGFHVESANDGIEALKLFEERDPGLIVLDLMLPGMDGLEVCRKIRAQSDVPILMLTARSDDIDKIVGLELGADDYLTKPFNPRELVARIRAILRRSESKESSEVGKPIHIGNLEIDPGRRTVMVDQRTVDLRMKEFDLIKTLAENRGMVLTRERLLDIVWGYDFAGETRTVDVHVAHLRNKLTGMDAAITTVWGVGYKLEAE